MCLKVYAFFNMRKSDTGSLYLDSGKSFFYEAVNQQTEALRQYGVEQGILDTSELYQAPGKTISIKNTEMKAPAKNERGKKTHTHNDEEDHLSEDNDVEEIQANSNIIEEKPKISNQTQRTISRSQSVQTSDEDTNNQSITQKPQPTTNNLPKKQKIEKKQGRK